MKKLWKILLCALLLLLLAAGGYAAYVFIDYHRVPDKQALEVAGAGTAQAEPGTEYRILSYNIGFGAYTPDFGFFMDGGTQSRAASKASVETDLADILTFFREQAPDFLLVQEVDQKATRSWHVDERAILQDGLDGYASVFAVNYDSPYLLYPLRQPHGKSLAGILTFSRAGIGQSLRRSLPIESGFMKFLDLDRCYTVSRIPVSDGKELVLYNLHLSAYTSDGTIATEQLQMLIADMQGEYAAGNYVVCGGDFNKDLISGGSSAVYGISGEAYTWAQPFPTELLAGTGLTLTVPFDAAAPVPSCRNADGPYSPEQFVLNIDGFIVSDNVTVTGADVIDTGFAWSDHNPVEMTFSLRGTN